jgi:hypothetical protein
MKGCLSLCLASAVLLGVISLGAQEPSSAGKKPADASGLSPAQLAARAKAYQAPEIPFDSIPVALKMPNGMYFGEDMGVATNSKGHVFVFNRNGENSRLFEFDALGNYIHEIGKNSYAFAMAHAVRVDAHDNFWTVDEGTNTVVKWNGVTQRPEMIMGRRHEYFEGLIPTTLPVPPLEHYMFNRPTDIAWDKDDNIFISDGYNNSRAIKYDKNGRYVTEIGVRGTEPTQMNTPHSIQVDREGLVYVADRNNNRIQVFTNDLKLKAMYTDVGQPWAVCISGGPHQYLYSSNSYPDASPADLRAVTGEIYKMELDGKVIGRFGTAGKGSHEFSTTHAMDCRYDNTLLVAELSGWNVKKVHLKPIATGATGQAAGGNR